MDSDVWLSADDLVNCAQRQHCQVTPWQLERWRKADLVPRARKRSLGRGKGFEFRYPPGSCGQLVALCDLHRTERRLDHLRFALWRRGLPIPLDALKKTLGQAAELLVVRRDTLRIIDGTGPSVEAPLAVATGPEMESWIGPNCNAEPANDTTDTYDSTGDPARTAPATECPFAGSVPIDVQRFAARSMHLVKCPACGATRSLAPHRGVLHFKTHDKRKSPVPVTSMRWTLRATIWTIVGGEHT